MKKKKATLLLLILSITLVQNIQSAAILEFERKLLKEEDLLTAVEQGDVALLNECLRQGVNVNAVDINSNTVLMIAVSHVRATIVRLLLEYEQSNPTLAVNVNAVDVNGWTALMTAACYGYTEMVRLLLECRQRDENKVNINAINKCGCTALMLAAMNGNAAIVSMLLEYAQDDPQRTANINVVNNDGKTALMFAARYGRANVIKIFAEYNRKNRMNIVDGNIIDRDGLTALMLAISGVHSRKVETVEALLFPFKKRKRYITGEESISAISDQERYQKEEKSCWDAVDVNLGKRKR